MQLVQKLINDGAESLQPSDIDKVRIFLSAPNPEYNVTAEAAEEFVGSLKEIPYFRDGLGMFVLPGTYDGTFNVDTAYELGLLLERGIGSDVPLHMFLYWGPRANNPVNLGLVMRNFRTLGWDLALKRLLLDAFGDGREPVVILSQTPSLQDLVSEWVSQVFGDYAAPPVVPALEAPNVPSDNE